MRAFSIILFFIVSTSWAADYDSQRLQQASNSADNNDNNPNYGPDQWRLVPYLGWRKFAPVDAFYYDWLDFRRVTRSRYFIW